MFNITGTIRSALERSRSKQDPETDYLNQSVSIHDLERRQREIAHGKFRPSRYPF